MEPRALVASWYLGKLAALDNTKLTLSMERCQSGRMGLTANELTRETGSEGSNPSLSARSLCFDTKQM